MTAHFVEKRPPPFWLAALALSCAEELTGAQCDTLWLMHEHALAAMRAELGAIVARNRADFGRGAR